jgi:hypothetical protein
MLLFKLIFLIQILALTSYAEYMIYGNIDDYIDSQPAESCHVVLNGLSPNTITDSAYTDINGAYEFSDVTEGIYEIRIEDEKYVIDSLRITVVGNTVRNFTVYQRRHVLSEQYQPDSLTRDGSPYLVIETTTLKKALRIGAGVRIELINQSSLGISADVAAIGEADDGIVFVASGSGQHIIITGLGQAFLFRHCRFEGVHYIILRARNARSAEFSHCSFSDMFSALSVVAGSVHRLTMRHCTIMNSEIGLWSYSYSLEEYVDTLELLDNLFWTNTKVVGIAGYGKNLIQRNTFLGQSTLLLAESSNNDTISSNIFTSLNYENAGDKSIFLAYNNIVESSGARPYGIGANTKTNVKGDPCDYYYNISEPPFLADSLTGVLQSNSPCIRAGLNGENMGVYQGLGIDVSIRGFANKSDAAKGQFFCGLTRSGEMCVSLSPRSSNALCGITIFDFKGRRLGGMPAFVWEKSGTELTQSITPIVEKGALQNLLVVLEESGGPKRTRMLSSANAGK